MPEPLLMAPTGQEREAIAEIRLGFEMEFTSNPHLYYKKDLELIRDNEWSVQRFLMAANGNPAAGLIRLTRAMQWRKEWAVRDMSNKDFPEEFYRMMRFGRARNGSLVVISRAQFYTPIADWRQLFKKFFIFVLESLDRQNTDRSGVTVILDLRDCGLSTVDFDFVWFLKPIQSKYYPFLLKQQLNCDLPWILTSVSQLVMSLMPQKTRKLMQFVRLADLTSYVDIDFIPAYMGGTGLKNWSWISETGVTVEDVAKRLDISDKSLKKLMAHLQPLVDTYCD